MFSSIFLRRSATLGMYLYRNNIFGVKTNQTFKLTSYTTVAKYAINENTLARKESLRKYNSVRGFRTSLVQREYEKPHDHAKLWIVEKGTTVCLLFLIPAGLLIPNKLTDTLLAILITAHAFWGMEALVVEYLRVLLFGPMVPKVAMSVVYGLTVFMLGGLFYLNLNDLGMCRAFWRIWRNMKKPADSGRGGSSKCK